MTRVVAGGGARTRGRRAGLVRPALQQPVRAHAERSCQSGRRRPARRGRTACLSSKLKSTAALTAPTPTPVAGRAVDAAVDVPADRPAVDNRRAGAGAGAAAPLRDTSLTGVAGLDAFDHLRALAPPRCAQNPPLLVDGAADPGRGGVHVPCRAVPGAPGRDPATGCQARGAPRPVGPAGHRGPGAGDPAGGPRGGHHGQWCAPRSSPPWTRASSRGPASIRSRLSGAAWHDIAGGGGGHDDHHPALRRQRAPRRRREPAPDPRRGAGAAAGAAACPVRRSSPGT